MTVTLSRAVRFVTENEQRQPTDVEVSIDEATKLRRLSFIRGNGMAEYVYLTEDQAKNLGGFLAGGVPWQP